MPTLSFDKAKEATAIARVKGGLNDGEILYLHDGKTGKKRVDLGEEGLFELLPNPDPKKREVWYVAGQSGSGKSYVAKGLAAYYKKLFPDRNVYLISKLEKDETLDALKFLKRLSIRSFMADYPELEEFTDCMVIFDDWDTLDKDAHKVIHKLIEDLAIMGRHTNTTMLILSHYLTNYKQTRLILNEATHIVVYPMSTSYHALRHLIRGYVGVDEEDLKRHRLLGSRWLCYKKGYPMWMCSQHVAEMLFDIETSAAGAKMKSDGKL
jgi:hypothetical protein